MEVDQTGAGATSGRRALLVAVALVAIMAVALFLRAYWNVDVAAGGEEFIFFGGSDAYYEKRAIDYILENDFQSLVRDPLLNYPHGANNPNPPFYDWTTAVAAHLAAPVFFDGDVATSAWWVTLWAPAFWGLLTILPIYFLGRDLFGRPTGLVAAFFWAVSTSAIDATSFGDARHYAPFMFFITLTFLFYVKAIRGLRGENNWVAKWSDMSSVMAGKSRFFRERKAEVGYAVLAGISVAATGLIWKGFPYLLGVIGIYAVIQMVVNHWRKRDPMGIFIATFLVFAVALALIYPYYYGAVNLGGFVKPAWYMLAGFLFVGLILTPTRDLPTVLVMPLFAVGAIVGVLVAFVLNPAIGNSLLYSAVYFKKTALYQTISEAHPAAFNHMVFSVGPWPFFAALVGLGVLVVRLRKEPTPVNIFLVVWGLIALYMAHTAARFLVNAVPLFALLGAWITVRTVEWLDFGAISRAITATQSTWQGIRRGFRAMHGVGVAVLALFLVLPSAFFAADAAVPSERETQLAKEAYIDALVAKGESRAALEGLSYSQVFAKWREAHGVEQEPPFKARFMERRFGAFGQGDVYSYWHDGLEFLDQHDKDIANVADRPGILSWWDYGHIEIYKGRHPAVADNFQNGYVFAANFLLAQNETAAIQLLAARHFGLKELPREAAIQHLVTAGVPENDAPGAYEDLKAFRYAPALDESKALKFLSLVEGSTGKKIRYLAVDARMLPYDDPETPQTIENPSIFQAPVVLAGQKTENYIEMYFKVTTTDQQGRPQPGGTDLTQAEYEARLRQPFQQQVQATGQFYAYKQPFFNSMFWKTYSGGEVRAEGRGVRGDALVPYINLPRPAEGLSHFRLIYANDGLRILEFTPGAVVSGVVQQQNGQPLANTRVTAMDDAGGILRDLLSEDFRDQVRASDLDVAHASTTTDSQGRFTLRVPFGNVTLLAGEPEAPMGRGNVQVTRAEAEAGKEFTGVAVTVQPADLEGEVYLDANGNNRKDANETVITEGRVEIQGQSAPIGPDGKYSLKGLTPGFAGVNVTGTPYVVALPSQNVILRAGEAGFHNVSMTFRPVEVSGVVYRDENGNGAADEGEAASFTSVSFTPKAGDATAVAKTATALEEGKYTVQLAPGTYVVSATKVMPDGKKWTGESEFTVPMDATIATKDVALKAEA